MALAYELAKAPEDVYQTVEVSDQTIHVKDTRQPGIARRLFWIIRGGWGRPRRLHGLEPLQGRFHFLKKPLSIKPLSVLFYPQGPGSCDHNKIDRTVNILTSLPFFGIAWHTVRHRKTWDGKLWGASLAGVGAGSLAFHSTSGDMRPWARKLDYWTIALSSIALMRSVFPQESSRATALALLATPVQPLAVSSVNAIAMEGQYLRRARANPDLQQHFKLHAAMGGLAAVCFAIEDLYPHWTIIHSTWHCLSAVGVATTNYLMADVERERGLCDEPPTVPRSPHPTRLL